MNNAQTISVGLKDCQFCDIRTTPRIYDHLRYEIRNEKFVEFDNMMCFDPVIVKPFVIWNLIVKLKVYDSKALTELLKSVKDNFMILTSLRASLQNPQFDIPKLWREEPLVVNPFIELEIEKLKKGDIEIKNFVVLSSCFAQVGKMEFYEFVNNIDSMRFRASTVFSQLMGVIAIRSLIYEIISY